MKMKTLILILLLSLSTNSEVNLNSIWEGITVIESNKDPTAIGDNGMSWGIVQIQKIAVDDVNRIYNTSYTHEDAFDVECAKEIFHLYLYAGIVRFYNKYNRMPTEQEVVRMWNGGIYRGYRRKTTIKYYKRYENNSNINKRILQGD